MLDKKALKTLTSHAAEVFGTHKHAAEWLNDPDNPSLGCSPIEYIQNNEKGVETVRAVLGRIQYGAHQ